MCFIYSTLDLKERNLDGDISEKTAFTLRMSLI